MVDRYPHQLSGGMRQRAVIAMALSCSPTLLLADEPTTALDVTVQAQILELLLRLRQEFGSSIVLITHDMGVVAEVADRVMVMYAGRIVERGAKAVVLDDPQHPYTAALLESIPPMAGPRPVRLPTIPGSPPSLLRLPPGCAFAPRCRFRMAACARRPALVAEAGHAVACFLRHPDGQEPRHDRAPPLLEASISASSSPLRGGAVRARPAGAAGRGRRVSGGRRGETLGLVGESGCGKSTLGRCLVRLYDLTAAGCASTGPRSATLGQRRLRPIRRRLQMVFQDPSASLNPRRRVGDLIAEPLRVHGHATAAEIRRAGAS